MEYLASPTKCVKQLFKTDGASLPYIGIYIIGIVVTVFIVIMTIAALNYALDGELMNYIKEFAPKDPLTTRIINTTENLIAKGLPSRIVDDVSPLFSDNSSPILTGIFVAAGSVFAVITITSLWRLISRFDANITSAVPIY